MGISVPSSHLIAACAPASNCSVHRRQKLFVSSGEESCMSRLKCLLHMPPWPTGVLHLVVAFGAVVAALCLNARTVNALDTDSTTAESAWCIETGDSGAPPNCTYHDFLTCAVAAVRAGASCKAGSSIPADGIGASSRRAAESSRRSPQSTTAHRLRESSLSIVEREKLFHEFVEWNRRRSNH
jgi:hypothetical protein